jgi:hypothetical protein
LFACGWLSGIFAGRKRRRKRRRRKKRRRRRKKRGRIAVGFGTQKAVLVNNRMNRLSPQPTWAALVNHPHADA